MASAARLSCAFLAVLSFGMASSARAEEMRSLQSFFMEGDKSAADYAMISLRCTGLSKAYATAVKLGHINDQQGSDELSKAGPAFLGAVADLEGIGDFEDAVASAADKGEEMALQYTDLMIANINSGKPAVDELIQDDLAQCLILGRVLMN